jgi:RNA polymerase sigma-70 factor (ECF subfamily)
LKPSVKIDEFSDEDLVKKIVETKESVLFAELYDRYAPIVYNKCLGFAKSRVEAEDLTHDIFIKLYMKLHTFKGTSKFSTWMYSFTYNFCVNYVQRNSYKIREKVQLVESDENEVGHDDDYDIFQLKAKKLKKVLSIIDPKDKMILLLKYQDELSIKELQTVFEISESAVKMRLKRAREKVMAIYKKL